MNRIFKSLTDNQEIDIIPYIKSYLLKNENTDIYIGCDSQNIGRKTIYATVIVLHNKGRGGHVLYSTEWIPRIKILKQTAKTEVEFTRLWA